jgi:uncharacterized membrane protein (DUF2068 family)
MIEVWTPMGISSTTKQIPDASQKTPVALRSIALLEGTKGLLVLAAACGILSLRNTDLHAVTDAFLWRHGINPERHYTRLFIESVANATHHHVGQLAVLGFAYALVRLVEGYGLWQGKHWAEWFAVISAGIYLPFEFQHLARRPTLVSGGIILFNLVIIVYLARLLGQQRAQRRAAAQCNAEMTQIPG